jgi:hypothetical protein
VFAAQNFRKRGSYHTSSRVDEDGILASLRPHQHHPKEGAGHRQRTAEARHPGERVRQPLHEPYRQYGDRRWEADILPGATIEQAIDTEIGSSRYVESP